MYEKKERKKKRARAESELERDKIYDVRRRRVKSRRDTVFRDGPRGGTAISYAKPVSAPNAQKRRRTRRRLFASKTASFSARG